MSKIRYMVSLAETFEENGDYPRAAQILQTAVRLKERELGPDHFDLAEDLFNLALLYWVVDNYSEAERMLRRSLEISKRVLGNRHRDVLEMERALSELGEEMATSAA